MRHLLASALLLSIAASASAATAAINVRASRIVTLRDLDVTGLNNGIRAENEANVIIAGVTAKATGTFGTAVTALGASISLGGPNPADAVLLHDSAFGVRAVASQVFAAGWLTVENTSGGTQSQAISVDGPARSCISTGRRPAQRSSRAIREAASGRSSTPRSARTART